MEGRRESIDQNNGNNTINDVVITNKAADQELDETKDIKEVEVL